MKWIDKKAANEPQTLRDYRQTTPNASYKGFTDADKLLKKALCSEQGSICCYCMRRISIDKLSVEHYITQTRHENSPFSESEHRENELLYQNMLAPCNDKSRNCSGIRGNNLLIINPLQQKIERHFGYKNNGEIYALNENTAFENDIKTLDLNKKGQNSWLVQNRAAVVERARERLHNDFSKQNIQKEIAYWQRLENGEYKEFCQVALFYLNKKLRIL